MSKELKDFLITCPLALLSLIIPLVFKSQPETAAVLLLVTAIVMLLIKRSKKELILYTVIMISGPIAESIAIYFGAWTYAQPVFIGVPLWLPFVWGNAALYIIRLRDLIYSL